MTSLTACWRCIQVCRNGSSPVGRGGSFFVGPHFYEGTCLLLRRSFFTGFPVEPCRLFYWISPAGVFLRLPLGEFFSWGFSGSLLGVFLPQSPVNRPSRALDNGAPAWASVWAFSPALASAARKLSITAQRLGFRRQGNVLLGFSPVESCRFSSGISS